MSSIGMSRLRLDKFTNFKLSDLITFLFAAHKNKKIKMKANVFILVIISTFYCQIKALLVPSQFGNYSRAAVSLDSQICATIGK